MINTIVFTIDLIAMKIFVLFVKVVCIKNYTIKLNNKMFIIYYCIYEEKIKALEKEVKVEYRFIPRSYYDEQIFSNEFSSKFSNLTSL